MGGFDEKEVIRKRVKSNRKDWIHISIYYIRSDRICFLCYSLVFFYFGVKEPVAILILFIWAHVHTSCLHLYLRLRLSFCQSQQIAFWQSLAVFWWETWRDDLCLTWDLTYAWFETWLMLNCGDYFRCEVAIELPHFFNNTLRDSDFHNQADKLSNFLMFNFWSLI